MRVAFTHSRVIGLTFTVAVSTSKGTIFGVVPASPTVGLVANAVLTSATCKAPGKCISRSHSVVTAGGVSVPVSGTDYSSLCERPIESPVITIVVRYMYMFRPNASRITASSVSSANVSACRPACKLVLEVRGRGGVRYGNEDARYEDIRKEEGRRGKEIDVIEEVSLSYEEKFIEWAPTAIGTYRNYRCNSAPCTAGNSFGADLAEADS